MYVQKERINIGTNQLKYNFYLFTLLAFFDDDVHHSKVKLDQPRQVCWQKYQILRSVSDPQ